MCEELWNKETDEPLPKEIDRYAETTQKYAKIKRFPRTLRHESDPLPRHSAPVLQAVDVGARIVPYGVRPPQLGVEPFAAVGVLLGIIILLMHTFIFIFLLIYILLIPDYAEYV